MTKGEAIEQLQDAKYGYKEYLSSEALDMAIKALEQMNVLDKIRAEIDELDVLRFSSGERIYKDEALDIIDKYRGENEGKE